jgi:hypothetical protein
VVRHRSSRLETVSDRCLLGLAAVLLTRTDELVPLVAGFPGERSTG